VPGLPTFRGRRASASGFTFIELLVVTTILLILASAVMPLARVTVQRQKEMELRRYLREMRTAIDKFKDAADAGVIGAFDIKAGSEGPISRPWSKGSAWSTTRPAASSSSCGGFRSIR